MLVADHAAVGTWAPLGGRSGQAGWYGGRQLGRYQQVVPACWAIPQSFPIHNSPLRRQYHGCYFSIALGSCWCYYCVSLPRACPLGAALVSLTVLLPHLPILHPISPLPPPEPFSITSLATPPPRPVTALATGGNPYRYLAGISPRGLASSSINRSLIEPPNLANRSRQHLHSHQGV